MITQRQVQIAITTLGCLADVFPESLRFEAGAKGEATRRIIIESIIAVMEVEVADAPKDQVDKAAPNKCCKGQGSIALCSGRGSVSPRPECACRKDGRGDGAPGS